MSTENKQSSSFYVPHFTPANYGSFFLAGQILHPFPELFERSDPDPLPQEHYVLRALMHYWQKPPFVLTCFSLKDDAWRYDT
jgi:hypothetical protein